MLFHPLRSPFPEQRHPLTMFPSDIRHIILTPHKTGQTYNTKKAEPPFTDGSASIFILPKRIGKGF